MITPTYLKKTDSIGLLAPASRVIWDELLPNIAFLESNGYKTVLSSTLKSQNGYFSATDEERTKEFQKQLDNSSINAILMARGGYGCSKIIDKLDFTEFKRKPKWIIGFSDITILHLHLQKMGFESIHGPMLKHLLSDYESTRYLLEIITGGNPTYCIDSIDNQVNTKLGKAEGILIGGNLTLLAHSLGSDSDLSFDDKILFIEEVDEYLYNIDRLFVQLKRAKKLSKLKGLIVGKFSQMLDSPDNPFGKNSTEIIQEHTKEFDYPVLFNFPSGHDSRNFPLIMGRKVKMEVDSAKSLLEFSTPI